MSGALPACSSARWVRCTRRLSACTRSVSARLVPKRSVCTSMATSELTSSTPERSESERRASVVDLPARISSVTSSNSAASTGCVRPNSREMRCRLMLMPRPASTQTTIRSRASGRPSTMSSLRAARFLSMK